MRQVAALVLLIVSSAALASQPGQPLDCSDWVFTHPGYGCTTWASRTSCSGQQQDGCLLGMGWSIDNGGAKIRIRALTVQPACGDISRTRYEIVRFDGTAEDVIAWIEDRCSGASRTDALNVFDGHIAFDAVRGSLQVPVQPYCQSTFGGCPVDYDGDGTPDGGTNRQWAVQAISGFTPLFEMLQTYTPQPSALGFRTPYMPEGFRAADHFDTYWGDVTRPIDLAQAHPLQCAYPNTPPSVGDYLTFADGALTPAPGHANYYLTSVTYRGQTRAGRKAENGRLSGRDASRLPACVEGQAPRSVSSPEADATTHHWSQEGAQRGASGP